MPLHHDQALRAGSLCATYQGSCARPARAADREPGRAARACRTASPRCCPSAPSVECFDRPGRALHVAAQEIRERPLADETDAGAVGLVVHRQAGAARAVRAPLLAQLAEREQHASVTLARDRVQEVGLILVTIARLIERRAVLEHRGGAHSGRWRTAARRAAARSQAQAEFDLAIAQHIGIRGAAGAVLRQEMSEYLLAVLVGKIHPMQDDAELGGDSCARPGSPGRSVQ